MADMTESVHSVVVVGAGLAGAKTAEALRDQGYDGGITPVGDESKLPYERPALSKGYLQGKSEFEVIHPAEWYEEQRVDLRLGGRVESIDGAARPGQRGEGDR